MASIFPTATMRFGPAIGAGGAARGGGTPAAVACAALGGAELQPPANDADSVASIAQPIRALPVDNVTPPPSTKVLTPLPAPQSALLRRPFFFWRRRLPSRTPLRDENAS